MTSIIAKMSYSMFMKMEKKHMPQYLNLEEDHDQHHSKRSIVNFLFMVLCNCCRFSKLGESIVAKSASIKGAQFERQKCKYQQQHCSNVENNIEMSYEDHFMWEHALLYHP